METIHATLKICKSFTKLKKSFSFVNEGIDYFLSPSKTKLVYENLCLLFLIKFLFFNRMKVLQKLWKMFFISLKKLYLFSRYSNFCNFLLPIHTFQIKKDKGKWNNVRHLLACIDLLKKLLYITSHLGR